MSRCLILLMYHSVVEAEDDRTRYRRSLARFREDLDWLQSEGYETIRFADLDSGRGLPEKPVIITFDDASKSWRTLVLDELLRRGMRAEFFLVTGWCNTPNHVSSQDVRELASAGMGIQSHTVTHVMATFTDRAWLGIEMGASARDIESLSGRRPIALSFPGGYVNKSCREIGQQLGYRFFCTSRPGRARLPLRTTFLPRIEVRGDGPALKEALRPINLAARRVRYFALHLAGFRGHRALARVKRWIARPNRRNKRKPVGP